MDTIKKNILLGISISTLLLVTACKKEDVVIEQVLADQNATASAGNSAPDTTTTDVASSINNRDLYPDLSFIESSTISDDYLDYTLVDVRSNYEYRVLRMADSISIPANDSSFEVRLKNLVRKHRQTVVLYGNGGKERNAHDAARIAKRNNIANILVFDGNIITWAETTPQYAELHSKAIDEDNTLINPSILNSKYLDEDEFIKKYSKENSLLLDIRDDNQTNKHALQSSANHIPLDHQSKLLQFLNKAKLENKTLFIYDNYGLQVRWLIYQLQKLGIENYYFQKDGV